MELIRIPNARHIRGAHQLVVGGDSGRCDAVMYRVE